MYFESHVSGRPRQSTTDVISNHGGQLKQLSDLVQTQLVFSAAHAGRDLTYSGIWNTKNTTICHEPITYLIFAFGGSHTSSTLLIFKSIY